MYEFRLFLVFFAVFVILGALASEMWSLSLIHYAVIAAVSCGAMLAAKKLFKANLRSPKADRTVSTIGAKK